MVASDLGYQCRSYAREGGDRPVSRQHLVLSV